MDWTYDPTHSHVGFRVRHMGLSTVRGGFGDVRIEDVTFDPQDPTTARGRVRIATASIATGDEKRDAHLTSPDFFDAGNHAEIVFEVTGVERAGSDYRVRGNLTIKGVTREIVLDGEFLGEGRDPFGNQKAGISLSGDIDRTEWGLTWNVALEAGGFLVSQKVKLEIEAQLVQQVAVAA